SQDKKGWIICACVLLLTVVRSGITYSFGEFVVQLQKLYHRPMAEQNWIGTLSFTVSLSFSPVTVLLIRYIGFGAYRIVAFAGVIILCVSTLASSFVATLEWMFLTHSILYGVGSSFTLMTSSLVIGDYFDKHHKNHVLATSILLCGYPVGSLLFNPINAWLVSTYDWRAAFRATSVLILLVGVVTCSTFVSKNAQMEANIQSEITHACNLQAVRQRPEIVLWLFGNFLVYIGFFMPFLNLASYMQLKRISAQDASYALTVLSLLECISYVIASFLGDYFKGYLVIANCIACSFLAVICFIWPAVDITYTLIMVIAGAMGAFLGLNIVYTYAASGEVTNLPIDVAWSVTNLWSGIGILSGPLFSGLVYDMRRNYDDVFYVTGGVYTVGTIAFAIIPLLRRWRQGRGRFEYEDLDESPEKVLPPNGFPPAPNETTNICEYEQEFRSVTKSLSKSSFSSDKALDPPLQDLSDPPIIGGRPFSDPLTDPWK
ncbi:monocarboxylate transporter 13-like, partial [Tubulanus polymorphus]|uniref:monocarboxylate transporter 13-like n=1 Tax=Tubulanus polymorphus TaxID=672921 RepID=UPI003DA5A889